MNDAYKGPLGANFPLTLNRPYQVVRRKEQLSYNFGQYMEPTTDLLDLWVRHSQTNSLQFMEDTSTVIEIINGNPTSQIVATDFGVEPMAYVDSIVNDSIVYLSGYYYHFIGVYPDDDLQLIPFLTPDPVNYWYPINPNIDSLQMTYSIYIQDSTLASRYDFDCDSLNILIDTLASIDETHLNRSKIYPNPGLNELSVELHNQFDTKGKIQLLDGMGRLITELDITNERKYRLDVAETKDRYLLCIFS